MGKAATAVRTPGEDAPAATDTSADPVTTTGVLEGAAAAKVPGAPMSMEDRFAAMEAEMMRLQSQNAHLLSTQATLVDIARAGTAAAAPTIKLPSAKEFPVEKQAEMKTAVLTQDGWVVPAHLGSSPVLHELQKLGLSATA